MTKPTRGTQPNRRKPRLVHWASRGARRRRGFDVIVPVRFTTYRLRFGLMPLRFSHALPAFFDRLALLIRVPYLSHNFG
jgi:hypothetical protein